MQQRDDDQAQAVSPGVFHFDDRFFRFGWHPGAGQPGFDYGLQYTAPGLAPLLAAATSCLKGGNDNGFH